MEKKNKSTKNYKNQFESFLEKNSLLPFESWGFFELEHGDKTIFKSNLDKIRKEVDKKSGIYVYKKGKDVLYVGKAVSLFGRLKSHNRESFELVSGDTKHKTWHKFFSKNAGDLCIYWKEVELEKERAIIEKILEYILKPRFGLFRKNKEDISFNKNQKITKMKNIPKTIIDFYNSIKKDSNHRYKSWTTFSEAARNI